MVHAETSQTTSAHRQPIAQREADRALSAGREHRLGDSPRLLAQRKRLQAVFGSAAQLQAPEEEMALQGRFAAAQRAAAQEDEPLQGRFVGTVQAVGDETAAPNLTGMPDPLKSGIEALSGMNLSDVRVHANSSGPAQLNALAYAQGNDIHLGPGQEQHLPHEAWHVVQQRQGRVQATMQMAGVAVNDDVALEHEADVMGARAHQMQSLMLAAGHAGVAAGDRQHGAFDGKLRSGTQPAQLQVVQGLFINNGNNAALYPHLHTDGQFMGYTYGAGGNQLELRSNGGNIRPAWFQDLGIALGGQLAGARLAHHNAILNWISNNEPDVWDQRR